MKTYIIEFQRAEQYDEACNSKPRSFAKAFNENATLSKIVQWVKETAGVWINDYNILTNPQIIGITEYH
jgi:trehalose-6-phosphate synthase